MNANGLSKILILKGFELRNNIGKNNHNFNWYQIKVVDRESTLIPRKIEEAIIHSLKNANQINKFYCIFQEINFLIFLLYNCKSWLMKETQTQVCNFIKKDTRTPVFSCKFLGAPFLQMTPCF